jgi:hypothetical protein
MRTRFGTDIKKDILRLVTELTSVGVSQDDIHEAWEWCLEKRDMPREDNIEHDGLSIMSIRETKTEEGLLEIIRKSVHGSDERLWAIVKYMWVSCPTTISQLVQ